MSKEIIYITNIIENNYPVLLRIWKKDKKQNNTICSRLDSYNNFSIPFLGSNKHIDMFKKKIKIMRKATDIEKKLLNW